MNLSEIASILQIGFSGFAFLMAMLSYRLLHTEGSRKGRPRSEILNAVGKYTKYTLVMALLVIFSRGGELMATMLYDYNITIATERQRLTSIEAQSCRDALSRLLYAETKVNDDYRSLLQAVQESAATCDSTLRRLGKEQAAAASTTPQINVDDRSHQGQ